MFYAEPLIGLRGLCQGGRADSNFVTLAAADAEQRPSTEVEKLKSQEDTCNAKYKINSSEQKVRVQSDVARVIRTHFISLQG